MCVPGFGNRCVSPVLRASYGFGQSNGGIEVGGFIVEVSGGYALTPLVLGTATQGEQLASVDLGPHLPAARLAGRVVGWWHTHPGGSHNFSNSDGQFNTGVHNYVGRQVAGYAISSNRIGVLRSNSAALYPNISRGVGIPADRSINHGC